RLYWAYDEAQSLGSFLAPSPHAIFGRDAAGAPLVDVRGMYPGGVIKTPVFKRCYRTPQELLTVAQAVNMGLYRKGGPVQGITTARAWGALGYDVEGQFRPGSTVTLRRKPEFLKHSLDTNRSLRDAAGDLLTAHQFPDEEGECDFVAREVRKDIEERGLKADH